MIDKFKISTLVADRKALEFIKKKDLAKEPGLMRSCWWDYRGVHPVKRTMMFAGLFTEVSKIYEARDWSVAKAPMVSGLVGDGMYIFPLLIDTPDEAIRKKSNLTGLWRARQTADELGIAYPTFLMACFEYASLNGWTRKPRPMHLYSDAMKMAALDRQAFEIVAHLPEIKNELLMAGAQNPVKAEFDRWLRELGQLREARVDVTYNTMRMRGWITEETMWEWIRAWERGEKYEAQ